ncbi:zinc finger, CCHC-type containing protein [Tanacetum coccineum]|uniref:Zinc finger, CCHC-type containing protein n=1 Tax=Tanacetum coccineum TaxID=301880 RepID=A0ABQ5C157_9ASTR
MGDENPIRNLGDYSKPSHEGYMNTIELPVENNVVPLRSDTIRLVQNRCSFHGLWSEDPNQHLKDFLKLVDSLNLDGENKERTRIRLFQISLRDQASNWLERLPAGSITTWEDLTTRFLAQFFTPGRTAKLLNDILMFQQHHGESLSEAWTHARLSKFEADFKQQQNEMTNKIDIVLKAITDRIAGALPSDTVKNPKLSTSLVLSARSYPTEDSQCSTIVYGSINIVTRCPKQPNEPQNDELKEKEQGKEGNPEDTNTMAHNEEQRDTSQLELKDTTVVNNLGPDRIDEGIEWLDIEEPLDLIDISEELVYESQTQEMPKCSLNYDFRIKKGYHETLRFLA